MRSFLIALAIVCSSGGGQLQPQSLDLIEVEEFTLYPSVSAELTFDAERSPVGWGSFDLTAHPELDEIRVDLLVGMPADDARWSGCKNMRLTADGETRVRKAQWAGVPMREGVFDAMRARLTIEDVRMLIGANEAHGEICGERFELSRRHGLRDFVEAFDEIATTHGPSAPTPPFELSPEHEFFPEEPLKLPFPA